MTKRNKIILVVAMIILAFLFYPAWKHHKRITPLKNLTPTHFITVFGHLDEGLYLKIGASYTTDRNICGESLGVLVGGMEPEYHDLIYMPTIDKDNNYTVTIPLDGLLPGICHWGVGSLFYIVSNTRHLHNPASELLIGFYIKGKPVKGPTLLMRCSMDKKGEVSYCDPKDGNIDFLNFYFYSPNVKIDFIKRFN